MTDDDIDSLIEEAHGAWTPSETLQPKLLATIASLRTQLAEITAERDAEKTRANMAYTAMRTEWREMLRLRDVAESRLRECEDALRAMHRNCFSSDESRLALVVGNGPGMSDGSENAVALHARCDRIRDAFILADRALTAHPQPKTAQSETTTRA